jgi:hypothetical protein
MRGLSLAERAIMGTARVIAGRERRTWLDAMEAELLTLRSGRLDWALGSFVASVKDRVARDWIFALALTVLPSAALAAVPILSMLSVTIARATGLTTLQLMPVVALAPAPFAFLLGAVRPRLSPWLKGLAAFALYQAIPVIGFMLLFGAYVTVRWEANLSAIGLTPPLGLLSALLLWCAGSWLGSRWASARSKVA